MASVTIEDIRQGIRAAGLSGLPLCVHSSLRSFGQVEGGAPTIIQGCLAEACTVLVPAFVDQFEVYPPPEIRVERNGWDYRKTYGLPSRTDEIYSPQSNAINRWMGAIPTALLAMPDRVRGNHPLNPFAAVGPLANELISGQRGDDVYAPLEEIERRGGSVVLMGVGLDSMTAIHLAEQRAGRRLFRRWATGPDGVTPVAGDIGSCSGGFPKLDPVLAPIEHSIQVGASRWRIFPMREALVLARDVIVADPEITRCSRPGCIICEDAIAGGPLL